MKIKNTRNNDRVISFLFMAGGLLGLTLYLYGYVPANSDIVSPTQFGHSTTVYPTLYSDQHITENAKIADARFRDSAPFERYGLLANISSSIRTGRYEPGVSGTEYGTWLWTPTLDITPAYMDTIIAGAVAQDINTIYLSLDSYLDIFGLPDGPEKETRRQSMNTIIEAFITKANAYGLQVDAEAGWRNWAEPGNEYKAFALLDYVIGYNQNHAEKFRGFQYDVEPYLLPEYKKDPRLVLHHFVSLIDATLTKLNGTDLSLSVVVPEFYDGGQVETPKFRYGLRVAYPLDHLLHVLERRSGSSIIVMAYRNVAAGKDGAIVLVEDEIEKANKYSTKVIIAQEIGDVPPPYITFHATSRAHYIRELQTLKDAFSLEPSYGGVAAHYVNALFSLK